MHEEQNNRMIPVYVGTYTRRESFVAGKAVGIQTFLMDPRTGELTDHAVTGGLVNPSFLALDGGRGCLYAVNEIGEDAGPAGLVSAFRIDPATAELTLLNSQETHGFAPWETVDLPPAVAPPSSSNEQF